MKDHELLEAVGGINDKYINSASIEKTGRAITGIKWFWGIAACVCLIALVGIYVPKQFNSEKGNDELQSDNSVALDDSQHYDRDDKSAVQDNQAAKDTGIYIPAVELPDASNSEMADMIGLIVYQGHIYTQSESYYDEDAVRIESLVGDYLGTAKGNIEEWSSQDDYATEFASNIMRKVYSVNGYDESFRICTRIEYEGENQTPGLWIQFYDCLNDITLSTGKDLFEDRLNLRERTQTIQWQSHYDWDNATGNIQVANIDQSSWEEFWNQVDNSEILYTWNNDNERWIHCEITID